MRAGAVAWVAILLASAGCLGADAKSTKGPAADGTGPDYCRSNAASRFDSEQPEPRQVLLPGAEATNVDNISSVDGHNVPITVHRPLEAGPNNRVPVLLHGHGWSGSRVTGAGAFDGFHEAGFGVVSIDMRGHGEARSTSEARVLHMDFEIRDVQAVIDYIATLPWVLLDAPGDPRLGALGGSYGGGYQLLTAAVDPRLDAIAPDITWNDLVRSLAPDGAVKSAWVDALYAAGNGLARVHLDVHAGYAVAMSQNRLPDGSLPAEPDLVSQFLRSSAASYPESIRLPTLLTQGANDTLFSFNEAIHNYEQLSGTCRSVRLVTHLDGHLLPQLQAPGAGSPCGDLDAYRAAFYQVHLLGLSAGLGPRVCLALEDGSVVTAETFPVPGTSNRVVELPGEILVPQGAPYSAEIVLWKADAEERLVGIPTVRATFEAPGPEAIMYFGFVAGAPGSEGRLLNAQVWPARVGSLPVGQPYEFEVGALSARLAAGEELRLFIASFHEQFAHNGERVPGVVTLRDLQVTVPVLEE